MPVKFSKEEEFNSPIYKNFDSIEKFNAKTFRNFISDNFKQFKFDQIKVDQGTVQGDEYALQNQQKFVPMYSQNPKTEYGNLLIYHKPGSGKTCTSIILGEAYRHFSDNNNKIIVATPKAIIESYRNEILGKCLTQVLDNNNDEISKYYNNKFGGRFNDALKRIRATKMTGQTKRIKKKQLERKISNRWNIITHDVFLNELATEEKNLLSGSLRKLGEQLYKGNNIIIIDEIQNMVSEFGSKYKKLSLFLNLFGENNRIIVLSGTPIYDKPYELGLTINLLNPRLYFPRSSTDFNKLFSFSQQTDKTDKTKIKNMRRQFFFMCYGYVSYYSGGNPLNFPKRRTIEVKHLMETPQLNAYIHTLFSEIKEKEIIQEKKHELGTKDETVSGYFINSRQIANISFNIKNYDKKETSSDNFYNSLGKDNDNDNIINELKQYSSKFSYILKLITNDYNRKILIYSDMIVHGCEAIKKLLQKMGYTELKKTSENTKGKRFAYWTGESKNTEHILEYFNDTKNLYGENCRILIGSTSIMEGVTLKDVNEVHILNPWWNDSRIEQVIARAIRFGSHKELKNKGRDFVNVYKHISILQNEENDNIRLDDILSLNSERMENKQKILKNIGLLRISIDTYMYNNTIKKNKLNNYFNDLLKSSAVDCQLNTEVNLIRLEEFLKINPNPKYKDDKIPIFYRIPGKIELYSPPNQIEIETTDIDNYLKKEPCYNETKYYNNYNNNNESFIQTEKYLPGVVNENIKCEEFNGNFIMNNNNILKKACDKKKVIQKYGKILLYNTYNNKEYIINLCKCLMMKHENFSNLLKIKVDNNIERDDYFLSLLDKELNLSKYKNYKSITNYKDYIFNVNELPNNYNYDEKKIILKAREFITENKNYSLDDLKNIYIYENINNQSVIYDCNIFN